jgi:hypothetical protein
MKDSELLFPSETGSFRSPSALDKPFSEVGKAIRLRKRITPRAMRRTFQDLARNADIEAIARQKICGHATDEMSDLYSTVPAGDSGGCRSGHLAGQVPRASTGGRVVVGKWWGGPRNRQRPPRDCAVSGRFSRAGEGVRTLDVHLGKVALYH